MGVDTAEMKQKLMPQRIVSHPTEAIRLMQNRYRAAMRWRARLGIYCVYSSPKKRRLTISSAGKYGPL